MTHVWAPPDKPLIWDQGPRPGKAFQPLGDEARRRKKRPTRGEEREGSRENFILQKFQKFWMAWGEIWEQTDS